MGGLGPGLPKAVPVGPGVDVAVEFLFRRSDGKGCVNAFTRSYGLETLYFIRTSQDIVLPASRRNHCEGEANHGLPYGVGELHRHVLCGSRRPGLEPRRSVYGLGRCHLKHRNVILCSHYVCLYCLVCLLRRESAGKGHRSLVEGSGRYVAVVASVTQQDGPLLAHRVITAALVLYAAAVVEHLQRSLLGVSAHRAPAVRSAVNHLGHEPPVDALEGLAVFVVRIFIDAAHQVVLLVGHKPRARIVSVIPLGFYSKVGGLHCSVAVVSGVCLCVAVVKAAAVAVMVAVDHPVLAFCLVIHGGSGGIVPSHSHSGYNERSVNLVTVQSHGCQVCKWNVVHSAHRRAYHIAARGLDQMVLLGRLVVYDGNEAVCVRTEGILGGRIGISAGFSPAGRHYANVQGLAVGLADYLVQRPVVVFVQGPGGAMRGGAGRSAGRIDVTGALRPGWNGNVHLGLGKESHQGCRNSQRGRYQQGQCQLLHIVIISIYCAQRRSKISLSYSSVILIPKRWLVVTQGIHFSAVPKPRP